MTCSVGHAMTAAGFFFLFSITVYARQGRGRNGENIRTRSAFPVGFSRYIQINKKTLPNYEKILKT